ncbi:MAG: ABC transporter permease subunit [Firmicutes bacterium]|nr:ABC transporter permease subunit [Bacillota bacterium]
MTKNTIHKLISFIAALAIFGLLIFVIILMYPGRNNFEISLLIPWSNIIIRGWFITIIVSIISLFASIVLGFFLYLLTNSKILVLKYLGDIFNEVVFGSPLVVFLIVVYYFIGVPLNLDNRFVIGVIALSLYMAPYMKNVFAGAMESIDELQYQAMTVFGFTTYQKYRYIIIPQILKILIPPLAGNLTFIVKGSSLLNFIGVKELYNQITTAQSNTYAVVEGYLLMFVMYLIITIPLIRLTKNFEKRVATWI